MRIEDVSSRLIELAQGDAIRDLFAVRRALEESLRSFRGIAKTSDGNGDLTLRARQILELLVHPTNPVEEWPRWIVDVRLDARLDGIQAEEIVTARATSSDPLPPLLGPAAFAASEPADGEAARFLRNLKPNGDCWMWTGQLCNGFPVYRFDGGLRVSARRAALEILEGARWDGDGTSHVRVRSTCHQRRCVRPQHSRPFPPPIVVAKAEETGVA